MNYMDDRVKTLLEESAALHEETSMTSRASVEKRTETHELEMRIRGLQRLLKLTDLKLQDANVERMRLSADKQHLAYLHKELVYIMNLTAKQDELMEAIKEHVERVEKDPVVIRALESVEKQTHLIDNENLLSELLSENTTSLSDEEIVDMCTNNDMFVVGMPKIDVSKLK